MTTIRVLLDTTWATGSGGTARYARSMAAALRDQPGVTVVVASAPRLRTGPRILRLPLNGLIHLTWTQLALPVLAWWRRADIIHTSMTAPIVSAVPVVVTLHDALDFIPDLRPSRIWSAYMRTFGALAARQATLVLTGTDASATEITHWFRLDPRRVHVTPYGSDLATSDRCHEQRQTLAVEGLFVLMVGAAERRKDLKTGLRAVELVRDAGVDLRAVVIGSVPERFTGLAWMSAVSGVSDFDLAQWYAGAVAVIVPSRHEGFGLPVIEALAFGTPVVASDLPALREAGGDAVRYAPAGDAEAFARELREIVADPAAARQAVRAVGVNQVSSWAETAQVTVALYRKLLGRER